MTFEAWLRTVCFQRPTPEAYDLAKDAWLMAQSQQNARIAELEATVEQMKCCGNCTYFYDNECSKFPEIDGEYCDKWESDTLTQEDRK